MPQGRTRGVSRDATARRALVEEAEVGVTADAGAVLAGRVSHDTARTADPWELPHPDSLSEQPPARGAVSPDTDAATTTSVLADAAAATSTPRVPEWDEATTVQRSPRPLGWARRYVAVVAACDAIVGALSVLVALTLRELTFDAWKIPVLVFGAAVAWPLAIAVSRGYERGKIGVGGDELHAVGRALILAIAVGAIPCAITGQYGVVAVSGIATPIAAAGSTLVRFVARKSLHRRQRGGRDVRRVIVVGGAFAAADLATMLTAEPHCGMKVVGVCVPRADVARAKEAGLEVLGDLDQVPSLIETYAADAVAVTSGDATRHNYLRELSWALEGQRVELLVHPGLIEVAGPRMHIRPYVGLPLLHVEQPHFTGWRRVVKRAFDVTVTTLGIIAISPILLGIALAVKLGDRGPVIFRQTRVGLDGSTFTMLKFRSMHVNAEERVAELRAKNPEMGTMFKLADDPRITRVGKFLRKYSLDELPQLFNVLSGSMSLVGPRPPLQSEVDDYEDHARRRLLVTPGLTGLWQVSGRSLLSWEETVRLDLRYVENWTLTLDLLILWKTAYAVAAKRGAF
jgi:exopolysaccharide biosynthesis polyprenyl glycosylphosphotransferase